MVILRRRLPDKVALAPADDGQGELFWAEAQDAGLWEFAVLATSLDFEVLSVAQLYRDRADAENAFDELKNQWGWGGFTTRDLNLCQHMARLIGLATTGGACSSAWPIPTITARPSPAGRCCCTAWPARPATVLKPG